MADNISPFICGYCKTEFKCFNKFTYHLLTHDIAILQHLHVCKDAGDHGTRQTDRCLFTCEMCSSRFVTICQLHAHLEEGSYNYNHKQKSAYPLQSLCAFSDSARDECVTTWNNDVAAEIKGGEPVKDLDSDSLQQRCKSRTVDSESCPDDHDLLKKTRTGPECKGESLNRKRGRPKRVHGPGVLNHTLRNRKLRVGKSKKLSFEKGLKIKTKQSKGKQKKKDCLLECQGQDLSNGNTDNDKDRGAELINNVTTNSKYNLRKSKKRNDKHISGTQKGLAGIYSDDGLEEKQTIEISDDTNSELKRLTEAVDTPVLQITNIEADSPTDDADNDSNLIKVETEAIKTDVKRASFRNGLDNHNQDPTAKSNISLKKTVKVKQKTASTKGAQSSKDQVVKIAKKERGRKKLDLEVCRVCGKRFRRSKIKQHEISHSDERTYQCPYCPKTYKYQNHLDVHMKSHSDVLPYYCEVCGQGFVEATRLRRHVIMHTDYRPFTCDECGAGFVTRSKLDRHTTVHTRDKKVQCDLCGLRFAHKDSLNQHISGIHNRERRFACQECDKTFFTNYQLKCHSMKHSGVRPYKCSMCKSDFIERKELRRHMRKQHNMALDSQTQQGVTEEKKTEDRYQNGAPLPGADKPLQASFTADNICDITDNYATSSTVADKTNTDLNNIQDIINIDNHQQSAATDKPQQALADVNKGCAIVEINNSAGLMETEEQGQSLYQNNGLGMCEQGLNTSNINTENIYRPGVVNALNSSVVNNLNSSVVNNLNSSVVNNLNSSVVSSLNPGVVFTSLNTNIVNNSNTNQYESVKISQYDNLPLLQTIQRFNSPVFMDASKSNAIPALQGDNRFKDAVHSFSSECMRPEQASSSFKHLDNVEGTVYGPKSLINKPPEAPSPDPSKNFLSL